MHLSHGNTIEYKKIHQYRNLYFKITLVAFQSFRKFSHNLFHICWYLPNTSIIVCTIWFNGCNFISYNRYKLVVCACLSVSAPATIKLYSTAQYFKIKTSYWIFFFTYDSNFPLINLCSLLKTYFLFLTKKSYGGV